MLSLFISCLGPFKVCRDVVDMNELVSACGYDLCVTLPSKALLCDHLDNAARVCNEAGVNVGDWRDLAKVCGN